MANTSEFVEQSLGSSISPALRTALVPVSRIVVAADWSVTAALEPAQKAATDARCLWCDRTFCTGHRQQFWIAARRWTMRAIDAGLLSVDCLKASHTSVHAA